MGKHTKKNKHKKNDDKELELDTIPAVDCEDINYSDIPKKKKKRKDIQEDIQEVQDINNYTIEKKKRKKTKEVSEYNKSDDDDIANDNNLSNADIEQPTKKKKKNQQIQVTEISSVRNQVPEYHKSDDDDNTHDSSMPQFAEDSGIEKKPIKKKKKKQQVEVTETSSGKKQKKSIRQMKREKFAQRQAEAKTTAKDQIKNECLAYLSQWKHDKQNWKFMKVKQAWLFRNKFSQTLLPDASWPVLLEYFQSAMGNIRNMLIDDANKVMKQMDDWVEKHGNEDKDEENMEESEEQDASSKPDKVTYKRARDLLQCLEE